MINESNQVVVKSDTGYLFSVICDLNEIKVLLLNVHMTNLRKTLPSSLS